MIICSSRITLFALYLGFVALISCNQTSRDLPQKPEDSFNPSRDSTSSIIRQTISDDTIPSLDTYAQMRSEYIKRYHLDVVVLDSSFKINNEHVKIDVKYKCSNDSSVIIPVEYNWGQDPEEFITHSFKTELTISKNSKMVLSEQITRESFGSQLTYPLNELGVLQYPSFVRDEGDSNLLIFHFSISIPLTDVGKQVTLKLNMEDYKLSYSD